jgi:hypothetical protein
VSVTTPSGIWSGASDGGGLPFSRGDWTAFEPGKHY